MFLDVARLLEPIEPDAPCGNDLRYRVAPLVERAKGTGRQEFVNGRQEWVTTPPDWAELERDALKLATDGKDLRLWVLLARAGLQREGLPGLAAGLRLIAEGLERYWPELHPQLDLEESDPEQQTMQRRNTLQLLVDPTGLLAELQRVPIVRAKGYGQFSLRAMRLAAGDMAPVGDEERPQPQVIEGAIKLARPEEAAEHEAARAAAVELVGLVARIETAFAEAAGSTLAAPSLGDLAKLAAEIRRRLPEPAAPPADEEEAAPPAELVEPAGGHAGNGAAPVAMAGTPLRGGVANREDVLRVLDLVLDYYRQREPSSPVPLLLQRARRLVPMSFVEAMRDLAPAGIGELSQVVGPLEEQGS